VSAVSAGTNAQVMASRARTSRALGGWRGLTGVAVLATLALLAVLAPLIAPHSPDAIDPDLVLGHPSWSHPLGSDALGRDVLSRVMFAYRTSLAVAIGSVLLALVVGIPLGLVAGYFRGWVDAALMRPVDLLLALPAMLLAISLVAIVGPGTSVLVLAIAIIYLPILARVMRGSALAVTAEPYVLGSRARGASHAAVLFRHVLPNAIGPVVVQASVLCGFAIQIEAALSFLGLGARPPTATLGLMLADGYQVLQQAWWADVFPGIAIAVTVLAFNFLGDGLRARLDPRGVSSE
jgi:peptide/nickel transport system permease protein